MPTLEAEAIAAPTRIVELTRLIRASRARIYEAWTNPEILKQWFGPDTYTCTAAETDARVGGAYRIGVTPKDIPEAPEAAASGNYTKVVPNQLLQFTWVPTWNPGEESLVTVTIEHVSGGTEVCIRHEHFAPEALAGYTRGWTGALAKLAQFVQRG